MRILDPATEELYQSGNFKTHSRFRVENGSGTLIDLSGRYISYRLSLPSVQTPIGGLTISLIRETRADGVDSLAPFIEQSLFNRLDDGTTYSPLILVGRRVIFSVALTSKNAPRPAYDSGIWYDVFNGYVAGDSGPRRSSHLKVIRCKDMAGTLNPAKSERGFLYKKGTPIESAIRQTLDNNGFTSFPLWIPNPTGKVLEVDYNPGIQKTIWSQVQNLAHSIAAVCWIRYKEDGTPALTLFQPEREKFVADMTIRLDDFEEFTIDEEELFNVGHGQYLDANGVRKNIAPLQNSDSIIRYGNIRRPFWISFSDTSTVRSNEDATAVVNAALSDVSDPDIQATAVTVPLFFAECGVDKYNFPTDLAFFSSDQLYAPITIDISESANEEPSSSIGIRERPTAGFRSWRTKIITGLDTDTKLALSNFIKGQPLGSFTPYTWTPGADVSVSLAASQEFEEPETEAKWASLVASMAYVQDNRILAPIPRQGYVTLTAARGVSSEGKKGPERRAILTGSVAVVSFDVKFEEAPDGSTSAGIVTASDVRGVVTGGSYFLKYPNSEETGPFDLLSSLEKGTWIISSFDLAPKPHLVYVRLVMKRNDGQPNIEVGPLSADSDKIPSQPTARIDHWEGAEAIVYVDCEDTDTESLWRREVFVDGSLGPKTEITPRGTDERFGYFTSLVISPRSFYIFAENNAGQAGVYLQMALIPRAEPPAVQVDVVERIVDGSYIGTAWWKVQELGLMVTGTEVTTQVGRETPSPPSAPLRTEGDMSVVRTIREGVPTLLGIGEREHDVLVLDRLSSIRAVETFGLKKVTVPIPPFDRNNLPTIVSITVEGTKTTCQGDSEVLSWTASFDEWIEHRDGAVVDFLDQPVGDTESVSVLYTARNAPVVDIGEPGVLEVSETRIVRGPAAAADPTRPRWRTAPVIIAPESADDEITIRLRAFEQVDGAPPLTDYGVKVWERHRTGGGWSEFLDVTEELDPIPVHPVPTAPPVDGSLHSFHTSRNNTPTGDILFTVQIKAVITDGLEEIDSRVAEIQYYIATREIGEPE